MRSWLTCVLRLMPGSPIAATSTFFFIDPAPTELYTRQDTLSLHDALPISPLASASSEIFSSPLSPFALTRGTTTTDRSEEHTSELQSPFLISYAVFCL